MSNRLHPVALLVVVGCGRSELATLNPSVEASAESDVASDAPLEIRPDAPLPRLSLHAGSFHTCLLRDGGVWCWGYNAQGQLGVGSTADQLRPVRLPLTGVMRVAAAEGSTVFQVAGDVLYAGEDESPGASKPPISFPSKVASGAAELFARGFGRHHCLRRAAGVEVDCWGINGAGQLGMPAGGPIMTPFEVLSLRNADDVVLGQYFTCGAFDRGVHCAGYNTSGQLGDGTLASRHTFAAVSGLGRVRLLSAGFAHACAVAADEKLWCWGRGVRGQLGDGGKADRPLAVLAATPGPIAQLALGFEHSCARLTSGHVRCWGSNDEGELGDGSSTPALAPVAVEGVDDAEQLVVGRHHACVRRRDDSVWCWGKNRFGALGNGTTTSSPRPVRVSFGG